MAIGKSVNRVDAVAKVTGKARYTDDFYMPGTLVAGYLRSTISHGRVQNIDTSKAEKLPGVEAIFTFKDVPQKKWVEYTILWSGIGEQLKHLGFDLIKITGADI